MATSHAPRQAPAHRAPRATPGLTIIDRRLGRRSLLRTAAIGGLVSGAALPTPATAAAAALTTPQWPGHRPGHIYLGAASTDFAKTLTYTGPLGAHRIFGDWKATTWQIPMAAADLAADRLPWISFRPPAVTRPWAAVASGAYDADIRARARAYAGLSGPVVSTFHHEPENDWSAGTGAEWAAAWCRVHDVMKSETGLKNVISVPVIQQWVWDPYNSKHDPKDWATPAVIKRCHFFGLNLYQMAKGAPFADKMPVVFDYFAALGFGSKMFGLAEIGATSSTNNVPGDVWWSDAWKFMRSNPDKFGVVTYYDSRLNNTFGYNWLLTETAKKLAAFKASLADTVTCRLA